MEGVGLSKRAGTGTHEVGFIAAVMDWLLAVASNGVGCGCPVHRDKGITAFG